MRMPDVNILVNAFRSDTEHHSLCKSWLEDELKSGSPLGLSSSVLSALVRITTHRRIFKQSSSAQEAILFCDHLVGQDAAVIIQPGQQHWSIFKRVCEDSGATGNLVQDGWYAALAMESASEWVTMDDDFAMFPELKWRLLRPESTQN
jgi:toxin-antitoxin system PIN domain toxin